jgi:hypothetical protein
MTTPRHQVQSAVEVYLDSLNCILYLNWDISKEDTKAKAIEYLTDLWLRIETQLDVQFTPDNVIRAFDSGADVPLYDQDEQDDQDEEMAGVYVLEASRKEREAAIRRHPSFNNEVAWVTSPKRPSPFIPGPFDVNL